MDTLDAEKAYRDDLLRRLQIKKFDRAQTIATIQGIKLADALGLPLTRIAIVRGIRYNPGFAEELYGLDPLFSRAINARRIMSNIIPTSMAPEEVPYCIWYPEVATEDTYRRLVAAYPSMLYQVARACAVAGYKDLYEDLPVLPEVHVAEEAREAGSKAIYDSIMSHVKLFSVMNDYDRTIDVSSRTEARLNGDTQVRALLDNKQAFRDATDITEDEDEDMFGLFEPSLGFEEKIFDVTEDQCIAASVPSSDDVPYEPPSKIVPPPPVWVEYLWTPLPQDLPFLDKDKLILKSAYDGNIERYSRLRRPVMIGGEIDCCIHGIYHNTMFAVWWSKQDTSASKLSKLRDAITARYIMNNVLLDSMTAEPYLIWYPSLAAESTYRALATRRPRMLPQITRACIVGGYKTLFDELVGRLIIDEAVYDEAKRSPDRHYINQLEQHLAGQPALRLTFDSWRAYGTPLIEKTSTTLRKDLAYHLDMVNDSGHSLYGSYATDDLRTNLFASIPQEWLYAPEDEAGILPEWQLDYIDFP